MPTPFKFTKEIMGKNIEITLSDWEISDYTGNPLKAKVSVKIDNKEMELGWSLVFFYRDRYVVEINNKILAKKLGLSKNRIDIFLPETFDAEKIKQEIIKEKESLLLPCKITFEQKILTYDIPIAKNEWQISYEDEKKFVGLMNEKDWNNLYQFAEEHNLFSLDEKRTKYGIKAVNKNLVLTKEIYNLIKNSYLPPEERKKIERNIEENQEKLNLIEKGNVEWIFVGKVHVDEDGCFSECHPYCDDCMWFSHIKKEYLDDFVKKKAKTFSVRNRKTGKVYTYFSPSPEILEYLKNKHKDVINKIREDLKKEIKEDKRKLENYENLLKNFFSNNRKTTTGPKP